MRIASFEKFKSFYYSYSEIRISEPALYMSDVKSTFIIAVSYDRSNQKIWNLHNKLDFLVFLRGPRYYVLKYHKNAVSQHQYASSPNSFQSIHSDIFRSSNRTKTQLRQYMKVKPMFVDLMMWFKILNRLFRAYIFLRWTPMDHDLCPRSRSQSWIDFELKIVFFSVDVVQKYFVHFISQTCFF
jgi:hypothetical protein